MSMLKKLLDLVEAGVAVTIPAVEVIATKSLAAAGDYAANDVMSETASAGLGTPFVFEGVVREKGGIGTITKAIATLETTALTPQIRLFLFRERPTSEMDDNAANTAVILADREMDLGYISFLSMADLGTGVSEALATPSTDGNLPLEFNCLPGDDRIFGIAVTQDAITGETALMELQIKLFIRQG